MQNMSSFYSPFGMEHLDKGRTDKQQTYKSHWSIMYMYALGDFCLVFGDIVNRKGLTYNTMPPSLHSTYRMLDMFILSTQNRYNI